MARIGDLAASLDTKLMSTGFPTTAQNRVDPTFSSLLDSPEDNRAQVNSHAVTFLQTNIYSSRLLFKSGRRKNGARESSLRARPNEGFVNEEKAAGISYVQV
jgi:hypothetical protein